MTYRWAAAGPDLRIAYATGTMFNRSTVSTVKIPPMMLECNQRSRCFAGLNNSCQGYTGDSEVNNGGLEINA